jgi:hypothetical protein
MIVKKSMYDRIHCFEEKPSNGTVGSRPTVVLSSYTVVFGRGKKSCYSNMDSNMKFVSMFLARSGECVGSLYYVKANTSGQNDPVRISNAQNRGINFLLWRAPLYPVPGTVQ